MTHTCRISVASFVVKLACTDPIEANHRHVHRNKIWGIWYIHRFHDHVLVECWRQEDPVHRVNPWVGKGGFSCLKKRMDLDFGMLERWVHEELHQVVLDTFRRERRSFLEACIRMVFHCPGFQQRQNWPVSDQTWMQLQQIHWLWMDWCMVRIQCTLHRVQWTTWGISWHLVQR